MNIPFVLPYFLALCLALLSIVICARMVRIHRFKYLTHYLYFLISINIAVLYGDVPENIGSFLKNSPQMFKLGGILSALLGTPMFLAAIYMFAKSVTGLLGKHIGKTFKTVYYSSVGVYFLGFISLIAGYFKTGEDKWVMIAMGYSMKAFLILFLTILIYFFLNLKDLPNQKKRRHLSIFGIFHCINFCFVLCYTTPACPIARISQNLFWYIFFTLQLFPLLSLNGYFRQLMKEFIPPGSEQETKALNSIFPRYNISAREKEVINLLLEGKSNREIENELFISNHTVRNHIYSIYKKLGIKNRVELVNFIRNFLSPS